MNAPSFFDLILAFFQPAVAFINQQNLLLIAPELVILVVLLFAILLLAFGKNEHEREQNVWIWSFFGIFTAFVTLIVIYYPVFTQGTPTTIPSTFTYEAFNKTVFFGMFQADQFSVVIRALLLLGTLFVTGFSRNFIKAKSEVPGEFYTILLSALLGGMFLSGARDLIMLFVALETLSISSYIMVGFFRNTVESSEAAIKYLIYGGAATAILLFGFSLFYGLSGSSDFMQISNYLRAADLTQPMLAIATVMVMGGFAFKLSAAPFHMWAPDVYEGAPTPVTAFLSVVSKVAGFSIAMRFFYMLFPTSEELFKTASLSNEVLSGQTLYLALFGVVATISVLSMAIGNIVALVQTNIKRLLAYSTIAHAGYMLLGLLVLSQAGLSSLLYYLASYLFANLGAFAVVIYVNSLTGSDSIQSYAGLIRKRPALTLLFTIFLLSLSGMPITAGFFGKFFLFQAVAQAGVGHMWLVMVALLTSTISMYYYLNVVRLMVIADPSPEVEALEAEGANLSLSPIGASLAICAFATIVIGVLAEPFLSVMSNSVRDINSFGVGSLSHNTPVQPLQQQAQAQQALQLKVVANKSK